MGKPLWQPSADLIDSSNLTRFAHQAGFAAPDYDALHAWSVDKRGAFWQQLWDFTGVIADRPASRALRDADRFPGSKWFDDAKLNYAANLLRYNDDRLAIVTVLETGERQALSYADLYRAVARVAAAFAEFGVTPGDRVAGWMPNTAQTVIAMLAATSLGAVWSSCSPEFGVDGALDRFGQIEPKLLVACSTYTYNGKPYEVVDKVEAVARKVSSIEHLVWDEDLETIIASRREEDIAFVARPFNAPLYVMYSSGTTGKPKCIVHGIGGTLLQHLKEHQLHVDLRRDDVLFFFTTCGWMMWNWLVSALATGSTLVLYDGSPFHPQPDRLFELVDAERISVLGVSAKYLSALEKAGAKPRTSHDLGSLRSILSTGSPLAHESFNYVYRDIKSDVWLASMSGGTDLISCFVLGCPWLPVHEGELQARGLGMAVDVFDEQGRAIVERKGELVCTKSFPSAPTGFWNDPGDAKFHAAYFEKYDNVWAHGDFAEITGTGGMIIHGRSDAVLNPGGVRIGTAEIYRQVEEVDGVVEALCVSQEWDDDTRVVLFVVLREGLELDAALEATIRHQIRSNTTPRHVPAVIKQAPDVPRTMSGKIAELTVRDVIHGREVHNASALANPESLAFYEALDLS